MQKFPSTFGSFNAQKPEPQKPDLGSVIAAVVLLCIAVSVVMLTVKLGFVLFT